MELQDICFVYNEESVPVWKNLSCSFCENTINLLLGPSGCGKSSLLYLIDGLIPNSLEGKLSGSITLRGESIFKKEPRELANSIGLVFQDPDTQFCTFLVEDELAFGLENLCVPQEEMDARIDHALSVVGLIGFRKRTVASLSGGQKQKLAIACALIMEAELLLLDEPTAMLDAASRKEIIELLQQLVTEHHKTVILVEHNLDEVMPYIGHIVVMGRGGNVVLQGSANDVFTRLTYDAAFARLPVYLPEPLLILRKWLHTSFDARKHAFCAQQLQRRADGPYELPYASLAEFIRSLLQALPQCHGLKPERDAILNAISRGALIEAQNVSFQYASKEPRGAYFTPVLQDVGFSIREGEFIAIAGPNGAGKTTLLNILFHVLKGYEGQIDIAGEPLHAIKKQALYREMGLLFQNPEWQFVTNGVADELAFSLKKSTLTEKEKCETVNRLLIQFHLEQHRDKSPFLLSQGEKRRLSVACMLLTGQKVLFFDEPTYGQDSETSLELMQLLQTLRGGGVTVVIVTHDMSLVSQYADRLLLLCDGSVTFDGKPADLFSRELEPQWRMEHPSAWQFASVLHELVPDFPICFKTETCVSYLNSLTGEDAHA